MTLVLALLAALGAAHVLTESVVGRPWRLLLAWALPAGLALGLAYCARCVAFWVGCALAAALYLRVPDWALVPLAAVGFVRLIVGGLVASESQKALDGDLASAHKPGTETDGT